MRRCFIILLLTGIIGGLYPSNGYTISIITQWNPIIIDATIENTPQPTIGTRTMMIIFTSAYDTYSAYDPVALGAVIGNTLDGTGGEATDENMREAISHAIYTSLIEVAPLSQPEAEAFMAQLGYDLDAGSQPAVLGRTVAQMVVESRENDGSNHQNGYQDTTGYEPQPPSDPDAWQPLIVPLDDPNGTLQKPLTPHWGLVTPFAIDVDNFRLAPPAEYGSTEWDAQIDQILEISANLTPRQKVIAEYWRPIRGTPPMLWGELAAVVSDKYDYGIAEDAMLYFAIHTAMFDAGVTCWENKYRYNYIRPITAIRNMGDVVIQAWGGVGMGTVEMMASEWKPYQSEDQPTPPFPEYGSGHSTFGSAWAAVMQAFTGSDEFGYGETFDELAFEGTPLDPPVELYWETFTQAAQEAGMSRLYGGIHFMDGNVNALQAGREVGLTAWAKAQALFNGQTSNVNQWGHYE